MYVCLYIISMFSLLSVRQSLSLSVLVYLSFFVCLLFAVCLTVFVFVQVIVFLKVFLCLFVTLCLFVNICLSVSLCVFFSLAKLKQIKNRLNIIEVKTSRLLLYCIAIPSSQKMFQFETIWFSAFDYNFDSNKEKGVKAHGVH